jgi:hypothetical protein
MASIDRGATKRVTFDEPLLVQVIEPEQEKYGPELNKSCSHPRKLVLWIFVTVFLGVLLTGSGTNAKFFTPHVGGYDIKSLLTSAHSTQVRPPYTSTYQAQVYSHRLEPSISTSH